MLCRTLQLSWCFSGGLCKVLDAHSLKILLLSTSCSFCSLPVIKNYLMNKSGQIQTMLRTGMFGKNFGEETAVALLSTTLQTNKPDFLSKGSNATHPENSNSQNVTLLLPLDPIFCLDFFGTCFRHLLEDEALFFLSLVSFF